jgi:intracellular sulfur oxidation DsrE/DsrF family protein
MIKSIIITALLISSIYAQDYKVIYNLTTSKESTIEKSILNGIPVLKKHYKSQGDNLHVAIIISAGSYKFFKKDISKYQTKLAVLVKSGVKFEVCSVGMKKRGIKKEDLFDFVKPVFNRTTSLIEWQAKDYSLVNVN